MKIKTSNLTGPALDWAVAKCEGYVEDACSWLYEATVQDVADSDGYHPSDKWAQGGPIIERERIDVFSVRNGESWCAQSDVLRLCYYNASYLVAAMRCFVASKLGEEVDIPEELK